MARESRVEKKKRTLKIIAQLKKIHPNAHCALHYSHPLELLVATILSAQCTDERVNIVTKVLFRKYKTAQAYAEASQEDMEKDIRSINFFRNKAKALRKMGQLIVEAHGGKVPRTMEDLVTLPGVGRKTANVVLGNAFDIQVGVVVDTHVGRLSRRLGLTSHDDPKEVEKDLMELVPQSEWTQFSHWLIWHGRSLCKARRPQCALCDLVSLCPQKGVNPS